MTAASGRHEEHGMRVRQDGSRGAVEAPEESNGRTPPLLLQRIRFSLHQGTFLLCVDRRPKRLLCLDDNVPYWPR